jgi:hypothetical protein
VRFFEVPASDFTKLVTDACKLYLELSHIPYKLEHPVSTATRAKKEKSQRKFFGRVGWSGGTFGRDACNWPGIEGSGIVLAKLWTAAANSL